MPRQRLRERTSPLVSLGRLVTLLFALVLIWYGLMTLLLALKMSPSTVNAISGYRTAFDWLSDLAPADVDGASTRAIIAATGVAAFLVFGFLALKQLPRPYLARRDLDLSADDRGEVTVEPRAIEQPRRSRRHQPPGGYGRARPLRHRRPCRRSHGPPRARPRDHPARRPATRRTRP